MCVIDSTSICLRCIRYFVESPFPEASDYVFELFWLLAVYRDFQVVMLMVSELFAGIEEVA